jgi:hypothetical protein
MHTAKQQMILKDNSQSIMRIDKPGVLITWIRRVVPASCQNVNFLDDLGTLVTAIRLVCSPMWTGRAATLTNRRPIAACHGTHCVKVLQIIDSGGSL